MNADEIQKEDDRLITEDVARAVEEQELVAYYQPVISLADGSVESLEALVRWTIPDGTVVPAALFVPSLDRTNTIFGLDWFMAEDVSAFLGETAKGTPAHVPASLNISARHAEDPDFAKKLASTVGWHDVAKDLLRIELSGSIVAQGTDGVRALVSSVQDEGFTVVVDNYESGIDGLGSLEELGIHAIKVAASFWKGCAPQDLATFVSDTKKRGFAVGAEGIETEAELEAARAAGFDSAQGYLLGEPMGAEALISALSA